MGAPKVSKSIVEQIWDRLKTKAQRERSQSYVPTEYSNVSIDSEGFLFVTTAAFDDTAGDSAPRPLRKLNAKGVDVFNRLLRENRLVSSSDNKNEVKDENKR